MDLEEKLIAQWLSDNLNNHSPTVPNNWPLSAWMQLVEQYPDFRYCVAHQANLPDAVTRRLAQDSDWRVRDRIASKRKLPIDLFFTLALDEDEGVRQSIARNKKTPVEILDRLKEDPSENVRNIALSRKP